MARENLSPLHLAAVLTLTIALHIHAQTNVADQLPKAIHPRARLFEERLRLEEHSPDPKSHELASIRKALVSYGQIVYRFVSGLAISPDFASDRTMIAAVRNAGLFRTTDAGMSWQPINSGFEYVDRVSGQRQMSDKIDVYCIEFSPNYSADNTIWVGAEALFKSENSGDNWQVVQDGISRSVEFSPNYIVDSTLFVISGGYSISRNNGKTWEAFGRPVAYNGQSGGLYGIYGIHLSPFFQTDSTVFLSTDLGYFKSINGARSWVHLWGSPSLFDPHPVSGVAFFPKQNPAKLALAGTHLGLYLIAPEDSIYQLPDIQRIRLFESVSHIVFDPEYPQNKTIYVSTAAGVFKSEDEGERWNAHNDGLTDLNVETFALSPNFSTDHTMVAGTHDGIFMSNTPQIQWKPRNHGLPLSFGVKNITQSPYLLDTVPTIASDSDDNLHVAWWGTYGSASAPDGITTDTHYSNNKSGAFAAPTRISVPTGYYSPGVSLAVDEQNVAHVAMYRKESLGNTFEREIYYANNANDDFENPILVADRSIGPFSAPSLALDANSKAHIAYEGFRNGTKMLYTNDRDGNFSTPVTIAESSGLPNLAIDRDGNAHVAYRAGLFGHIFYVNNFGGSFNLPTDVSHRDTEALSLALDSSGKPHIVFSGLFDIETFYVTTQGDSLSTPVRVSTYGYRPSIALDKLDHPHFSLNQGARYATIVNGNFEEAEIIVGRIVGNLNVGPRCIAVDQNNTVHVVFSMRSNSIVTDFNYDLYLISFKSNSNSGHIAYGSLLNENGSVPANDHIMFHAYITSRSNEILTGNAAGGGYKNGVWSVQCASFPSQWQVGDVLRVDFTNTTTGQTASVEDTLTAADLDLFPNTTFAQSTAIDESTPFPKQFYLSHNYPNPFNPETTISYQLPKDTHVKLEIFNLLGQRVATLVEKQQPVGEYAISWDGRDASGRHVASGLFLYRLQAGDFVQVRKLTLLR